MTKTLSRPSKTAELVTAARAMHLRYDDPVLLEDPFAIHLCGNYWRTVANTPALYWFMKNIVLRRKTYMIHFLLIRIIYGEQQLKLAIKRGVKQYVIIGAGYDSFVFRNQELTKQIKVFELDLPTTQEEKFRRMAKAGLTPPESVNFVASDLNQEGINEALERSGFDVSQPAFFSWFGVTYYLPEQTVFDTLDLVANWGAPGSGITFDYLGDYDETAKDYQSLREELKRFVARKGEPWQSSMRPSTIVSQIQNRGLTKTHHLPPSQVKQEIVGDHKTVICPPILGLFTASTSSGEESSSSN